MTGPRIEYKFLRPGAVGLHSGFRWPVPRGGGPGEWVAVAGELRPTWSGIHAVRARDLPRWILDELWLVELDGEMLEEPAMVVAERGRLRERVAAWDASVALEFADAYAFRARDAAVGRLRDRNEGEASEALERCLDLDTLAAAGRTVSARLADRELGNAVDYAIDVAGCVLEARGPTPSGAGLFSWVATGASTATVASKALSDGDMEAAALAERRWQAAWLTQRLKLA